jgi:uncharacterized repeat protein (TIGR03803 family)
MTNTRQPRGSICPRLAIVALVLLLALVATRAAQAQTLTVLHAFSGPPDGSGPYTNLFPSTVGGTLSGYGTTFSGGATDHGTVFKVDESGAETVVYSFAGGTDAANPQAGVVGDAGGNLYGTTYGGGAFGIGTVFKVDQTGAETVMYSFTGGADGQNPEASLIRDPAGNLYGTTYLSSPGSGTVFKLDINRNLTVLHSFANGTDGARPTCNLVMDVKGNLYGTTQYGGTPGAGIVFELSPQNGEWVETVLYSFQGRPDGVSPLAGLIISKGALYGTTSQGGRFGEGTVFKLDTKGETVLYSFCSLPNCSDGDQPQYGQLARDSAGNLFGTTFGGGAESIGTVYKVNTSGVETVLWSFTGGLDGQYPFQGLVLDGAGNLYGTAKGGGADGDGTVFKLTP